LKPNSEGEESDSSHGKGSQGGTAEGVVPGGWVVGDETGGGHVVPKLGGSIGGGGAIESVVSSILGGGVDWLEEVAGEHSVASGLSGDSGRAVPGLLETKDVEGSDIGQGSDGIGIVDSGAA